MNWRFWSRQGRPQPDTCASLEPLLSLFSDGMASSSEARRVESHLAECPECRRALEWMQATRLVIVQRPIVSPPADLRMRIAQAIAAEAAASASLRPAPRSFVLRPAYAMAASIVVVGALTLDHVLKPHTTVAPPPVVAVNPPGAVAPFSGRTASTPSLKPTKTTRTAKTLPGKPQPALLHPAANRPSAEVRTARANGDGDVIHAPQNTVVPIVAVHPLLSHVKTSPAKPPQMAKTVPTHPVPLPKTDGSAVMATVPTHTPLHSNTDVVVTPSPSVTPDTTDPVRPEPIHTEVAALPPPVVHEDALSHVRASLAAFRSDNTDRKIYRDVNARVRTASYSTIGTDNDAGTPHKFVMAPTVYTPTNLPAAPTEIASTK